MSAAKPIYSITPFTLLDYPDKTACILWFAGCNMRCSYCYNPDIVLGVGKLQLTEVFHFLCARKGLIDAVVLSGGECTQYHEIEKLLTDLKEMGFLVKIDTNGSRPDVLQSILNKKTIDFISLDFKAIPADFFKVTGSKLFNRFEKSLELLISSDIPFEIRTTIHNDLISVVNLNKMIAFVYSKGYKGKYYIQHFINNLPTLGKINNNYRKFTPDDIIDNKQLVIFRN